MANQLYDIARRLWADAGLTWSASSNKRCYLVSAGYAFDATHEFLVSCPEGFRSYGNEAAAGKVLEACLVENNGALTASQVRFTAVAVGDDPVEAIILANWENSDSDSQLLYYASTATGLPITPNGGDIIVTWSAGDNKILRL